MYVLRDSGVPLVLVDNDCLDGRVTSVVFDDGHVAELAVRKLVAQGRRRIALLAGPRTESKGNLVTRRGDKLATAYENAMRAAGLSCPKSYVASCDYSEAAAVAATEHLFSSRQPPDALIINGDLITKSALRVIEKKGLALGVDVAVLNYADGEDSPCLFITKPLEEVGRISVETLRRLMRDDHLSVRRIVVPIGDPA